MAKAKGSPKTGGRKLGTPNKVSVALQEAAQAYTPAALKTLNEICVGGESEAARVAAANSLLDRGHGRPTTHVTADLTHTPGKMPSEPISETAAWVERVLGEPATAAGAREAPNGRRNGT
jgi:hypothetical protein